MNYLNIFYYRNYFKTQKHILATMKTKQPSQNSYAAKSKISSSLNNSKPVHKQFQLLYRTREGLPSSQQYQSVFFMKHHKIPAQASKNKEKNQKVKKNQKEKKKTSEQKSYNKTSDKNKQKTDKQSKMTNTKSTVPFLTQAEFAKRQLFAQSFRETIDLQKTKLKKIGNSSNSNSSRYLNSKYLNKAPKIKKKQAKNDEEINSLLKTAKESSRVPSKINSPKSINRITKKKITNYNSEKESQYIFYDGQFHKASGNILDELEKQVDPRKSVQYLERNQFLDNFSIMKNENQPNQFQINQSRSQSIVELSTIQSFISFKAIIIQRWWRKILKQKQARVLKKLKPIQLDSLKEQTNKLENIQTNQSSLESYLLLHQQAVLNHMNSQKNILNKLKQNRKIDSQEFIEKISQVQAQFQNQMLGIQKIRQILIKQMTKIKQLQEKIALENKISSDISSFKAQDILQNFFQGNKENVDLNSNQYHNKKKSIGCHYKSEEVKTPIANIPQIEREIFQKQSSDENDDDEMKVQQSAEVINLSTNIEGNFENLVEVYQDQQNCQLQIQKRFGIQVGMIPYKPKQGPSINTSVMGIHGFLTNFIKFYQYFYKDEFLKLVNMPFGHNQLTRLKILQSPEETQQLENQEQGIIYGLNAVINLEALEDYHEHNYNNIDVSNSDMLQMVNYQKIHNRAVLDCFNQSLNNFRPYFFVNGPPYMWNYSEKALTFYFIAEENIKQVFEKTQYRVLRAASSLCGMIVDSLVEPIQVDENMNLQDRMIQYQSSINSVLVESRQQKLSKVEKLQIQQTSYEWQNSEEERTSVLLDVSNVVLIQLILEACCQLSFINQ